MITLFDKAQNSHIQQSEIKIRYFGGWKRDIKSESPEQIRFSLG